MFTAAAARALARPVVFVAVPLLAAGAVTVLAGTPARAAVSAGEIRGVNWADGRDNFVCGNLLPTGIWDGESYATVHSKASAITAKLASATGANTIRLPVNVDTVTGSWWNSYAAAIDASIAQGLNVILSQWDQCDSRDGRLDPGWQRLWDRVVERYGTDDRVLFEIMNEPYGYSASAWLDVASSWIARYRNVPRGRIIVSGPGYNDNAYTVGRDPRFNGTLLSVHHYAFWQSPLSYEAWRSQTRERVAEFAHRTVFTEYGTFMTTGLDFHEASPSAVNEIRYLRGVTDEFSALGVGSVYWPGLRSGDSYSLSSISGDVRHGSGSTVELRINNESGLARVRHAWRLDGPVGGTPSTTTGPVSTSSGPVTPGTVSSTGATAPCSAAYSVVGQWAGGFQSEITVTAGTNPLRTWTVSFTFPDGQTITQAWGAKVTQAGTVVTVTPESWNGSLGAGTSTTFGFIASWAGTNATPVVTCS